MCIKCGEEKIDDDFPFRDKKKGTRRNECRLCIKKYREGYYEQNKEVFLENARQYYEDNRDKILNDVSSYRKENKETISEYKQVYYEENKDRIRDYQSDNKDKIQQAQNEQRRERRRNDPNFKLRTYISNCVRDVLKGRKNKESTWDNLSYTPQELKEYVEKQFEPWMTWDNQGRYDPKTWDDNNLATWTWQLDHIIPQSNLPYASMEDANFKKCWALENLRPLPAKQNIVEGSNRSRHK